MVTDPKTTSKPISNRVAAKDAHKEMRNNGATHYDLGSFYKDMLSRRLGSSQSDLAKSLGVSESTVSRVIRLTRIPTEVVEAIGGAEQISIRIGGLLQIAIDKIGAVVFITRVREAVRAGYTTVDDILEFAVFDRIPEGAPTTVRVHLARDKRSIRVEIPDLGELLPHLSELEAFVSRAVNLWKGEVSRRKAEGAESARRRLRTAASSPKVGT